VKPFFSVVIPAYNREQTIRAAVDSVLRQTFSDFELIVVDDGSRDATVSAVREIQDPRLRLVELGENRGVSHARNAGLQVAQAPWVAFQDSDDEWLPAKLTRHHERLENADPRIVVSYCAMVILDQDLEAPNGPQRSSVRPLATSGRWAGDISREILRDSLVSTQMLVVRRDIALETGGFDESLRALVDWEWMIRLSRRGLVDFIAEPLVIQRFSANSITHDPARRVRARAQIYDKHQALYRADREAELQIVRALSGGFRRIGAFDEAQSYAQRLLALAPLSLSAWGAALAAHLRLEKA
jgi:glycosyltransferase involved in cell wall biosynthesis